MQELQDAFNEHYQHDYNPCWWNCLNESMSVWYNKCCQGFMCVPWKPIFGNEYHTICDGELDEHSSPILWYAQIQERQDHPLWWSLQQISMTQGSSCYWEFTCQEKGGRTYVVP